MCCFLLFRSVYRSRKQNARHAAEEHRRQLRSLLLSKRPTDAGVNGFNEMDDLQDDGTELLGTNNCFILYIVILCHLSFSSS